jgi:putative redox protein
LELIAIGLAGCTAMDVIAILSKKQQKVNIFEVNFEVKVHAERSEEHPKVFTHLAIEYVIIGKDISIEAVERAVELSANKYCPAQSMLKQVASMELKVTILE